jgi:thiol-disulfide isomerase/thioredoxin
MFRRIAMVVCALCFVAAQATPGYEEQLQRAQQLLDHREPFEALKAFQRANQLAGGKSAEAFLGMARAMQRMNLLKNAADACQSAIDLATDNPRLLARAHQLKGETLQGLGQMADADRELALAREINPRVGTVFAPAAEADRKPAPEFTITTTRGAAITLESLRGKIVLLDFWATWCSPCLRALPTVRQLQQTHANDPFVMVSISADVQQRKWHDFVDANGMVWSQYWDKDRRIRDLFGVTAIPTYVLIDADGMERQRVMGSGFHEARDLNIEIERQIAALRSR